jgi:phytoene dehydrogenase-like protein
MCAVSNPCALDPGIAPAGTAVVHAYLCANEDYAEWEGMEAGEAYERKKRERGEVLWRAVESVIPDARERVIREEFGSPLTHERFLRRPGGTYGAEAEDLLANGATPVEGLVLAGDGIFPGIGIPAVALTGAAAANAFVGVREQLKKY